VPKDGGGEISARAANRLAGIAVASDAIVVGPGMMNPAGARALAIGLLANAPNTSFVIDAAALPSRSEGDVFAAASGGRAVLTPHAGEMARMLQAEKEEVARDPLSAAREAAGLFQAVVVMKGPATWIVSPAGLAWRHDGGVPGLGASGSGDVLAGAIAGFLAQGHPPADAAAWGVFVHGAAGS
jgi:ADP-dependent NAD(P)H-hydrate dehydratase